MLADVREDLVNAEAQELVAAGHMVVPVRCDVSDDAQVTTMVGRAIAAFGRLDAAFKNAGSWPGIAPTATAPGKSGTA